MNLEELKKEHQYMQLTDKQRIWLDHYIIHGGDYITATTLAYECKDAQSARALGRQTLQRPEIAILIDKYYGNAEPTRAEFMQRIWKALQKATTAKDVRELGQLYARLAGWDKATSNEANVSNQVLRELFNDDTEKHSNGSPQ